MVQRQVFLKGLWGTGTSFIIFTFRNYSLENCVMHLKKNYFFLPPKFYEKSHSKLSKNEPEISHKLG